MGTIGGLSEYVEGFNVDKFLESIQKSGVLPTWNTQYENVDRRLKTLQESPVVGPDEPRQIIAELKQLRESTGKYIRQTKYDSVTTRNQYEEIWKDLQTRVDGRIKSAEKQQERAVAYNLQYSSVEQPLDPKFRVFNDQVDDLMQLFPGVKHITQKSMRGAKLPNVKLPGGNGASWPMIDRMEWEKMKDLAVYGVFHPEWKPSRISKRALAAYKFHVQKLPLTEKEKCTLAGKKDLGKLGKCPEPERGDVDWTSLGLFFKVNNSPYTIEEVKKSIMPDHTHHSVRTNYLKWREYIFFDHESGNIILVSPTPREAQLQTDLSQHMSKSNHLYPILTLNEDKERVLRQIWGQAASSRRAHSLWSMVSAAYVGITRNFIDMWINQTELGEITKGKTSGNEGYKVTNPIVSLYPGFHMQMDLMDFQYFSKSNGGMNWCLVVIDLFSKYIVAEALPNKTGPMMAKTLMSIFTKIGWPRILQADNGSEFKNVDVHTLLKEYGVAPRFSRAYRPQTQGQVERTNRTLKGALNADFLAMGTMNWVERLPIHVNAYNAFTHRSHGHSPFHVFFGRAPVWGPKERMVVAPDQTYKEIELSMVDGERGADRGVTGLLLKRKEPEDAPDDETAKRWQEADSALVLSDERLTAAIMDPRFPSTDIPAAIKTYLQKVSLPAIAQTDGMVGDDLLSGASTVGVP